MLGEFNAFIAREGLCRPNDRILLSVSGGPDSVLLAVLFRRAGYQTAIAHCNYRLRGAHADEDERFVRELAAGQGVPFFCISFPTREIAAESGKSIQEVARALRYEWLESIRQKEGYDLIATGHHLNDSIETMLINLARGCGIRGLHGILPRRGVLIRPLLFTGKKQITAWLEENKIPYREDLSNRELYYHRNKIRHLVVPVLESINPNFEKVAENTLRRLREAELLYESAVRDWESRAMEPCGNGFRISWEVLLQSPAPATLLHEFLSPFGFQPGQFTSLLEQKTLKPGKRWYSPTYCLLANREELLLEPLPEQLPDRFPIPEETQEMEVPGGSLVLQRLPHPPEALPVSNFEAVFDASKVEFPLLLRKWEAGDYFHPLGMKGRRKKIQDLFTDLKLSRFEKDNTWILQIAGQIAWVVGHRIDENFKMREDSTSCWYLRFEKISE